MIGLIVLVSILAYVFLGCLHLALVGKFFAPELIGRYKHGDESYKMDGEDVAAAGFIALFWPVATMFFFIYGFGKGVAFMSRKVAGLL